MCLKFYILKLTRSISPHNDIIPADLIKAGSRTIHSVIYKLTNAIWNKEELPQQWEESIAVPFYKKVIKQTEAMIHAGHLIIYIQN